ncbi:sodium:proton antiporter [Novosphingobium fuchskuhlense]|uniref:Na(+)/H(+) antiporter NhaA n=1 Tax=Novosphingobium fuchskuhlense TaxID=1117702 RepID=A0A124JW85_9SPHN|nr:Na+/H+ antiporter NhaA [Novosphingobium fuchskuhlense]KUR73070.1 sodium:proton antiporter [Novosphingobium fuchskuhlense]
MARNLGFGGLRSKLAASEAAPGLVLMACAGAALALANSPFGHAWHDLFLHALPWTPVGRLETLHAWINDGLMAVFFLVVGLEIKREFVMGALSDSARRHLPMIAALAGMAMPALVYITVTHGHSELRGGWAIPAATDIAFALGVLALLGSRVPPAVRLFLLTVAVVDDIGAIAVIALFYTESLEPGWLVLAIALFAAMVALNRFGARALPPYLVLAAALWFAVLHSGIHATVAGVLAAFTIPVALDSQGNSPLLRLEHALVGVSGFVIVPLFGLANAGVELGTGNPLAPLPLGIALGLILGKQAGIMLAIFGCERLGIAARPAGAGLLHLWGMALLCGIGFTMSLFIGALAFAAAPQLVEDAKLGVLAGSLVSALAGAAVLRIAPRPSE